MHRLAHMPASLVVISLILPQRRIEKLTCAPRSAKPKFTYPEKVLGGEAARILLAHHPQSVIGL